MARKWTARPSRLEVGYFAVRQAQQLGEVCCVGSREVSVDGFSCPAVVGSALAEDAEGGREVPGLGGDLASAAEQVTDPSEPRYSPGSWVARRLQVSIHFAPRPQPQPCELALLFACPSGTLAL